MGLTLFLLTIIVNLIATAIVNRATRRMQGACMMTATARCRPPAALAAARR